MDRQDFRVITGKRVALERELLRDVTLGKRSAESAASRLAPRAELSLVQSSEPPAERRAPRRSDEE